jgi:hypothetical protein
LALNAAFRDGQRVSTLRDISCTGVVALAVDTAPALAKKAAESNEK